MLILSSPLIHFGLGYSATLPPGWVLVEKIDDWAIGVSPDGSEYFLGPEKAYPRRKWGTDGIPQGAQPGECYIDMENGVIDLPNARGMARELAAQDSESTTDING
jgi:hypothetical protein